MRKRKKRTNNIAYLKLFILAVFFLSIVSIFIRSAKLYIGRSNKWESFNLLVLGETDRTFDLVSLDKKKRTVSIVRILEAQISPDKTRLEKSILLGVPVDAQLRQKSSGTRKNSNISQFSKSSLVSILTTRNFIFENMNAFDLLKIYFYNLSIPKSNVRRVEVERVESLSQDIYDYFRDQVVVNEGQSIEIVNASEVDGLGGRVARMLENVGFNVVSVSSSGKQSSRLIYRGEYNYTVKRLVSIFSSQGKFQVEQKQESSVADVTVILGSDD